MSGYLKNVCWDIHSHSQWAMQRQQQRLPTKLKLQRQHQHPPRQAKSPSSPRRSIPTVWVTDHVNNHDLHALIHICHGSPSMAVKIRVTHYSITPELQNDVDVIVNCYTWKDDGDDPPYSIPRRVTHNDLPIGRSRALNFQSKLVRVVLNVMVKTVNSPLDV